MYSKIVLVAALCALLGTAWTAAAGDTTSPTISSVVVTPPMVAASDTVHVTVDATDDTGVATVTADTLALENTTGSIWEGDVPANPLLGDRYVTVVASDAAGNSSQDTSGQYKTAQVLGISNDRLRTDPAAQGSASQYLFKVWGRATYLDENRFLVNDGGQFDTWVTSPGHGICNDDYVSVRGIVDVAVPPAKLTCVRYVIVDPAPRQQMTIADVTVGKDLQEDHNGQVPDPVPYGSPLPVTIMSTDPTKVLLSKTLAGVGTQSIVVYVPGGSQSIPMFYIHGLADSGTCDLVATAPGCLGKTFTATLVPSGFGISSPSYINTTSFSANIQLDIRPARLNPANLAVASWRRIRGGITAEVPVTSSDPTVGTIITSPVVFANGAYYLYTQFDPINPGVSTLSLTTPAGFTTPANYQSITATVTAPDIFSSNATVGLDLQDPYNVRLEAAPPSPVDVVVSVDDPSKATLSIDPLLEGTASITFTNVSDTSNRAFHVQGRGQGTTPLRATATGYNAVVKSVTVDPSGFAILSPSVINTTSFSANITLDIRPARLNPTTLAVQDWERVRGGKSVDVQITSSDTGVGAITTSPVTFGPNAYYMYTQFDPMGAGTSTVTAEVPPGFTAPSNYKQITATVTAADVMASDETVGVDLQTSSSVRLEAAPPSPVDIVVTVADPSKATITTDPLVEGSAGVTFTGVSNTSWKAFYVQGRALGTTTFTASAAGYTPVTKTVTIHPSGFTVNSPGATFRTTVYSANTSVQIASARLHPTTLAWSANQQIRGGLTVNVPVTSSDPLVGVITTSPVVFGPNVSIAYTAFDPVAAGTSVISPTAPPGFSTPSNYQQSTATVEVPKINGTDETVGVDLQTSSSVSLEVAPPSPIDIVVTVADPSKATLTTNPLVEGSASITFTNVSNTSGRTFYVQGRAEGTTAITATATGYITSNKTATTHPSGFVVNSPGSITTTVNAANTTVQIASARLNPTTFQWAANQAVRGGLTVDVPVVTTNALVGVMTVSPVVFNPNVITVNTAFDPVGVGTCAVSVEVPIGFSTPTNWRQINATVNP